MKFAKVLEQTLIEEDIPEEWVEAAIQYKALKKTITKVVNELRFLGLEQNDLKLLLQDPSNSTIVELDENDTTPSNPIIAEYTLTKSSSSGDVINPSDIQPMLKITLDYSNQNYSEDHIYQLGLQLKERIESLLEDDDDEKHDVHEVLETVPEEPEIIEPPNPQFAGRRESSGSIHRVGKIPEAHVQDSSESSDSERPSRSTTSSPPLSRQTSRKSRSRSESRSESPHERIIKLEEKDDEILIVSPPLSKQSTRDGSRSPPFSPTARSVVPLDEVLEQSLDDHTITDETIEETPREPRKNEIYISLNSDSKFFKMLNTELENLDNLKSSEESKLTKEVQNIASVITTLADPKGFKKSSDFYKWRQLFKIYLDSEVYFRYNETANSASERNSDQIKKNLNTFLTNVEKSGILTTFKNKKSIQTFNQFVGMNFHLLKILQFQSINSEAYRKILKKFDKQTSLGVSQQFPKLVSNDHIFIKGSSLAQSICFIIQSSILVLLPQLDDYTCPICTDIAYKPIKLQCGHLFCVRCLVEMKKEKKTDCPICRSENAVIKADGSNLDVETMLLMKKYFPKEVKEKLRERSEEKYKRLTGKEDGKPKGEKCVVM